MRTESMSEECVSQNHEEPKSSRGVVLVLAFSLLVGLAIVAVALLRMAHTDTVSTNDSQERVQALFMANAGATAVINELERNRDISGDGKIGSVNLSLSPYLRFEARSAIERDGYKIISTGIVHSTSGAGYRNLQKEFLVRRQVEVYLSRPRIRGRFWGGSFGDEVIDASGGLVTDSYDSRGILQRDANGNAVYLPATYIEQVRAAPSVDGFAAGTVEAYRRTTAGSQGNILSNGNILLSNNVFIYGDAIPGYSPTGAFYVSNDSRVTGSHAASTAPVPISAPVIPDTTAVPLQAHGPEAGVLDSGLYHYITWKQTHGVLNIAEKAKVKVVVENGIDWKGTIALGTGATLDVYLRTGNLIFNGGGDITTRRTNDFNLVVASAGTVMFSGNTNFFGTLYAPYAEIINTGNVEVFGALHGKAIRFSGGATVHFDLSATSPGIQEPFVIHSYREIDI